MAFDGRLVSGIGVLAAVVEAGSFVGAAEILGLTQPGVSRAIARLEARVGVRLLDRTTRTVGLTDEGRRFYQQVGPLLDQIEEAASDAAGSARMVRGRLRVNIDPYFSRLMVAARLGDFLERHPELTMECVTREHVGDLVVDGFDVAVRFGPPSPSSTVATKLVESRVITVASPAYLARHGRPRHPRELVGHACIQFRDPASGQPFDWEFHRSPLAHPPLGTPFPESEPEVVTVPVGGRLVVSDAGTLHGACLAGAGIAQTLALWMEAPLAQGALVDLFPDWSGEVWPLYALYPSRNLPPAKVRAFIDFIRETLGRAAPGLEPPFDGPAPVR